MYWEKVKFILVEESEIKGSKVDMFHSKVRGVYWLSRSCRNHMQYGLKNHFLDVEFYNCT